jgi:hypothetical protein
MVDLDQQKSYCDDNSLFANCPFLSAYCNGKQVMFRKESQKTATPMRLGPVTITTISDILSKIDAHVASGDPGLALVQYS